MPDSSADRDPLDRLAEDFVARLRRGEHPAVSEYADRHPDLAEQVRELFPALVEMEQLKPVSGELTGAYGSAAEPGDPARVGEFRILRRVGHGGMGVVYEAVQESLGRHVALKLLPAGAVADPQRLERFRREARAAARLHHTNIVPVFGVGAADGRHYYAMQFIPGHPLDAVITEVRRLKENSAALPAAPRAVSEIAGAMMSGTFTAAASDEGSAAPAGSSPSLSGTVSGGGSGYWATVARMGAQVADALAYAHGQGVLHRDVKPANLLLDPTGTVWVTDFGLAKSADADDLTHAGDIVGTLRYMAPERFEGAGDHRADVYALGLTLYELLTLRPAFASENRAKLVQEVTDANPPRPRVVAPAIPRDLETIVLKATARDPGARYQSAAAVADDLRRFLDGRTIAARRASSAEQAWRWAKRNPVVASLAAAVLLVSVVGATVSALIANEQRATAAALSQTLIQRDRTADELGKTLATLKDTLGEKDKAAGALDAALKDSVQREGMLAQNQDDLRRALYAFRINQAQTALNEGRVPRVMELLRDTTPAPGEPDLRGWEWNNLSRQVRPDREFTLSAPGVLTDVAVLCQTGERVLVTYTTPAGRYFEVFETLTGRRVGRVPATGVIPLAETTEGREFDASVFGRDGRAVLVRVGRVKGDKSSIDAARTRLWDVEAGDNFPVPAELAEQGSLAVVGPGTAGAVWIESRADAQRGAEVPVLRGPAEVTFCRWDRATGVVKKSDPFVIGQGDGRPVLSRDGGTVYWVAVRPRSPGKFGPPPADDGVARNPWFEGWDVTTPEPTRRFGLRLPTVGSPYESDTYRLAFSPAGVMAAHRSPTNEVVVYRLSDGEVHARLSLTGVPERGGGFGGGGLSNQFFAVSDDGNRVVLRSPSLLAVAEKTAAGVAAWTVPVADADELFRGGMRGGSRTPVVKLLAGGKTLVQLNQNSSVGGGPRRTTVGIWDVSRDPTQFVQDRPPPPRSVTVRRGEGWVRTLAVAGGDFTLEWPAADPAAEPGPVVQFWQEIYGGRFVVRDAGGKEIGPVDPGSEEKYEISAATLADGRRLLVHYTSPSGKTQSATGWATYSGLSLWALYDLDRDARQIDGGPGNLTPVPGAPYLLENPAWNAFGSAGGPRSQRFTLRDGRTGDVWHRVTLPDRDVVFRGFDPAGRAYLVESVARDNSIPPPRRVYSHGELAVVGAAFAGNPRPDIGRPAFGGTGMGGITGPFTARVYRQVRIHLFDAATHQELWSRDFPHGAINASISPAAFSPDGRRVVVRYTADSLRDRSGPGGARGTTGRLWIARRDGSVEHDLAVQEFESIPGTPAGFVSSLGAPALNLTYSPDGRHAAMTVGGEVEIWDLDAGERKHRLTGHDRRGTDATAAYNADGSRLFTHSITAALVGGRSQDPVHVWDTASGRELLAINPNADLRQMGRLMLEMDGGKLYLRVPAVGRVRVLDGTPVAP